MAKKTTKSKENMKEENQKKAENEVIEPELITKEETQNKEAEKESKTDKKAESKKSKKSKKADKKEEVNFEEKYNEMNDKYLRLSAEFDNFRKRTLKERMELIKSAGEDVLLNILPVVDDFDRAIKSMDNVKEVDAVKDGVDLIYGKFIEFLKSRGVKEIEAIGNEFDTDLHDAVTKIPAPEDNLKGKVIDVIEKGYQLNEKVIRFAKVVVGE